MSQFTNLSPINPLIQLRRPRFAANQLVNSPGNYGTKQHSTLQLQTVFTQPSSRHYQAVLHPQVKFGSHQLIDKEYTTAVYANHFVSSDLVMKTLRSLYLQSLYKKDENDLSHLKLSLGPGLELDNALSMSLSNNLLFFEKPVDTIISALAGPASVPSIMMSRLYDGHKLADTPTKATGKAFIYPTAHFKLGPVNTIAGGGENQVVQANRKISNSHLGKRLAMFMKATGVTDIKEAHKSITSAKEYTSLEALAFGKHGLVDGILVARDQVLTREKLEEYYKDHGFYLDGDPVFTERKKSQFNKNANNLYKIGPKYLVPLRVFSPSSMMSSQVSLNRPGVFHSLNSDDTADKSPLRIAGMALGHYGSGMETHKYHRENNKAGNGLFDPIYKSRNLESKVDSTGLKPQQMNIVGAKGGSSLIDDDIVYYGDAFVLNSADQLVDSIRAIKEKKLLQAKQDKKPPNNIKLILDSSGGDVTALHKILEELESDSHIKTDVILNGRAYSCGGLLLAAATGNRLATPISEIMLHNVSVGGKYSSNEEANQEADNMAQINKNSIQLITKSSGKPEKDVECDFLKTTFMNALDGLFYGEKGLLDGIIIGPHQVITRKDVMDYLLTEPAAQAEISREVRFFEDKTSDPNFESENTPEMLVNKYLAHRWDNYHDRAAIEPDKPNSLFDDPLNTIMKIASKKGVSHDMHQNGKFKNTVPRPPVEGKEQNQEIAHFLIPLTPVQVRK